MRQESASQASAACIPIYTVAAAPLLAATAGCVEGGLKGRARTAQHLQFCGNHRFKSKQTESLNQQSNIRPNVHLVNFYKVHLFKHLISGLTVYLV